MLYQHIWGQLPASVDQLLTESVKTLKFRRSEQIYRPGDRPQGLYFIKRGLVGLSLIGEESGKEHLLRFFKENQFFGHRSLFANEPYHATALCLQETEVEFIAKEKILSILDQHPEMMKEVIHVLSKELRRAEVQHVLILENQVTPRVAQALVYLKELKPDHNWTRQEIANFCASTTSTVIKSMAELEKMELISQKGRRFEILNRNDLMNLSLK